MATILSRSLLRASTRSPALAARALSTAASAVTLASGQTTTLPRPERVRRSVFNVPGSDERKLAKAPKLNADSLVYDLEDGVPFDKKGKARSLVYDALETVDLGRSERAVRINSIGSGLELADLQAVLPSSQLQCIVIPKVQAAKDVQFVDVMIDAVAPEANRANIRLIACIESALGLMNLREIATSSPRLDGLIFASEDLCADMGMVRTSHRRELLYARSAVVAAAVAYGLQAIDLVCIDYKDHAALAEESREGREMGFTGKQAIHPGQIELIHEHFSPSGKEIDFATRIVDGYRAHAAQGVGAFTLDGKMIDMPVVKWAEKLLAKAQWTKAQG
ncbi:hypothetical protein GGF32_002897 [Allomyces javanicus]|nr:hypothetical protein GGF32_002897 [Allomyces javanicus]